MVTANSGIILHSLPAQLKNIKLISGMPRAACPVTSEAYVIRVPGEHHNRLAILVVIRYSTPIIKREKTF